VPFFALSSGSCSPGFAAFRQCPYRMGFPPPQLVTQSSGRRTEQEPDKTEGQADLPQQIAWHIGIIPYVPFEAQIDQAAYAKFHHCDDGAACQAFLPAAAAFHRTAQVVEDGKAKAAGQYHSPM